MPIRAASMTPRDFALWKGHKESEPETASWDTPWGRGRPGWHLECSAMAGKYLGDEFDIHGGGLDLRFPHHENELAQSTAAGRAFARYWMHNALLTAAGEKMSKSLGNGALVSEVIKRFPARAVRLYLLQPHYRSTIEYSDGAVAESVAALERIDNFVRRASDLVGAASDRVPQEFIAAMNDDLGTPAAVAVLPRRSGTATSLIDAGDQDQVAARLGEVNAMLSILGLDAAGEAWQRGGDDHRLAAVVDGLIAELLKQRAAARERKDFASADAIRDALAELGVEVSDTPQGPRWKVADGRQQPAQGRGSSPGQVQHRGLQAAGCGADWRKGPTPKAEDRPYHPGTPRQEAGEGWVPVSRALPQAPPRARRRAQGAGREAPVRCGSRASKTGRPGSGAEWVVGRNPVLEAMEAEIPIKAGYLAEGAERDDRLRDILRLAADRGTALLQVTRAELDRLTGGAVHQGVALHLKTFDYMHPTICWLPPEVTDP